MSENKSKRQRLREQLTELENEGAKIRTTLEKFIDKSETREDLQEYGFKIDHFGYGKLLSYELTNGSTYQWLESLYQSNHYNFLQNYQKKGK